MGTENAMLAATLAEGHTVIRPAAQEPEVDDLVEFLCRWAPRSCGPSPDTIEVDGRSRLRGATHSVIPDRIETGTFLVAAAVTGGRVTLENAACDHVTALIDVFEPGWRADRLRRQDHPHRRDRAPARRSPRPDIATSPYPGLATDVQPPTCVLLTQASGTSRVHESVFEDRIEWLAELRKLGARIDIVDAHNAAIHGPAPLHGAEVDDRRPAGRRLAHPRRPRRRRDVAHPRRAPRAAGV